MTQGTHKKLMFKTENPHIKEDNLFNSVNQFSHMLECKMPQGQQSGDEQSPSPKNNSSNHISPFASSRLFNNSTRQFNSTLLNTSDQNQNFFSNNIALSNGISSASNSNGFQINGNKKLFLSSSKAIISAKAILETSDDPESSNHKNNSKTTATQSRNSTSHFEDHMLDSLKDTTSYSLNLTTSKGISGFQNNFSNIRNSIQNYPLKTIKNIPCENSLNNFSSSLFFDNSNVNNNNNNKNSSNNNNNTSDFKANENYEGGKMIQNIQINADFSSPTYNQNSFNQFNSLKNKSVKNNTNILVGNSNNTQKWNYQSTSKLILNSNLYQQQLHSINNQEDDEGEVFNNESLSQLWTNPSVLQALTQKNLQASEQNLLTNGTLKQQLNKNLLGESSFHKRSNSKANEQALTPSTMSHLNSNVNLNNSTNYLDDDDKGERSSRGLRNLSLKVKQIVVQKGQTSYKEVADQLVDELKSQSLGSMKPEDIQKDEQNIKRRVYDALNVLIASKVIEKTGKVVKSCDKSHLNGRCLQADNWKNVKLVESERDKKKETLLQKQKILTEYAAKYLALMNLMERNKKTEQEKLNVQLSQQSVDFLNNQDQVQELSQRMNTIKDQISLKDKILTDLQPSNGQSHIFKFPLILISVPTPENESSKVIVKMSKDQKNGKFFSQSKMIVHADLDVLLQMKMHQVDQQFASKYLNQEFISKYLVGNSFFAPQSDQSNESSNISNCSNREKCIEQADNQYLNENLVQSVNKQQFNPHENSKYQIDDSSIKQTKKAKVSAFKKPQLPKNNQKQSVKISCKKTEKSDNFDNEIELDD
ncbi:transcription factor e2f/dimerization partner (macronuclear) [Tetrahymena thermophila SB210]|uniref:Transcription factor e2f/dimerization partner n=1 Tax=Tetrahymena thermophila (strain SB210) TaxID=312017 RepID=Q22RE7_TETTS|nr:transcription factor e2f/dimerization partner [Tetrahymena thermophila SB210]EAR88175.2 transcription factor e2f/dimerization partner [Tetrahymena thermophila SB210]|eukprot:XP_001008420.2 transcription factor e2f/dimerization partner [Tetrahymena thermophila SB210]